MIEFMAVTILYYIGTNYTDFEWFYQDIFVVIPLVMTMGWTKANPKLTSHLP